MLYASVVYDVFSFVGNVSESRCQAISVCSPVLPSYNLKVSHIKGAFIFEKNIPDRY